MSQLKSGHERYVPNDGYIIHAESHTVDRGSTAYDVLKLACNAHGIRLTSCGKYKMDSGDNLVFYYVCTGADR